MTIFHALGKFLYNKRIYNGAKPARLHSSKMMVAPEKKPKLYFKHEEILNSTQIEKPVFSLYLHENMLNFYEDINDIADCLEDYSYTDYISQNVTFCYSNH